MEKDSLWMKLLHHQSFLVLFMLVIICVGVILLQMFNLEAKIRIQVTENNAAILIKSIEDLRTLYSSEVVARVEPHGIKITHDYQNNDAAIPLPATFSMMLGKLIGQGNVEAQVRIYSDYPFPSRLKMRGALDPIQKEVIQQIRENPIKPVIQIKKIEERNYLRFAKADTMRQSCINCHNTHPESPKTDWKVGDVRGVLEAVLPLDTGKGDVKKGIINTLILMAFLVCFGLTLLALVLGRLKKATIEANQFAHATKRANEDLEQQIVERKRMETALVAAEEYNRLIIESATDAIVIIDSIGKIIGWNGQAEEAFGWAAAEAIGQTLADLIIPADQRRAHVEGIQRFIATGFGPILNKRIEVIALHRNGHSFPIELAITPIKRKDSFSFCAFIRDITASNAAKEKVKFRQEELERLNRVMIGREKKMMELKNEILELKKELGTWKK